MSEKKSRKKEFEKYHGGKEPQEIDPHVLGRILAAQNVIFALPNATRIAEFYSQTLLSIPGITACRVCLADESAQAGEMENAPCAKCEASRRGSNPGIVTPADPDFKCDLINQPDMQVIAIDSYQHHFGFFVFKIDHTANFGTYQPFINNLSNYVAITFENRLQKELLQTAHHDLERRVEERTHDLTAANEGLQREIAERQRTEKALRESEEQVRHLFDASPVAMVLSRGDDERVEWVNGKFIELFGYTLEDMPDVEHWWPLAYPDGKYREEIKTGWNKRVEKAMQDGTQIAPMEATVRCKDGSNRHIEFRLSSIGQKHLVTFVDLTERKRVEEELQQNREVALRFSEQLTVLQEVTNELSKSVSFDDLCLQAVQLGRSRLGFDRVSIWFIEEQQGIMRGSFGTDERGELRDERNAQVEFRHEGLAWLLFSHKDQMALVEHRPLYDHLGREVGIGDNAMAGLWNGDKVIGVMSVDNLFKRQPINEHQLNVLRLYASALGHLIPRKKAEEELQKTNDLLRTIIEAAPTAIIGLDLDGKVENVWNPAAEKMLGWSAQEAIGNSLLSVFIEREDEFRRFREWIRSGKSLNGVEIRRQRRDGTSVDYSIYTSPLHEPDGKIIGNIAVLVDITGRKQMEEALVAREREFRNLAENSPDNIARYDSNCRTIYANPTLEKTLGHPVSDMLGTFPSEAGFIVEAKEFQDKIIEVLRTGKEQEMDLVLPDTGEGARYHNIRFVAERGAGDTITGVLAIGRDITERKRMEESLRASENRFRVLSENAFVGIYIIQEGRLSYVNSAMAKIFGYSPEELTGAPPALVIHPDDQAMVAENIRRRIDGEIEAIHYEFRGRCKEGEIKNIEVLGGRTDLGGQPAVIGNLMDITDRKRAEEEIRELNQELEQRVASRTAQLEEANKELEAFAYSVSHDLRAPLRHIDGFIDLLQKRTISTLDEKSRHYMDVITDSSKQMGTLIDDLLSFSRMSRAEMFKSRVDLNELVQDVIQEFLIEAEGRTIEWHVGHLPHVTCDRAMLRAVLVNLVSNAMKFTQRREIAHIEIGCKEADGNETVIYVRDNGVGFDMKYADKLFGVFQRLHHVDEFEGTGIGLANVRRIISRHGGKTWAEGEVDHGTTIYFSLPTLK